MKVNWWRERILESGWTGCDETSFGRGCCVPPKENMSVRVYKIRLLRFLLLLLLLSHVSHVWLCDPIDGSPPGSPIPGILQARTLEWVAIFLLQYMKVKSESEVAQSCPTLSDPMDYSLPGSSIHSLFIFHITTLGTPPPKKKKKNQQQLAWPE